jgi:4-amino-4-deoxy-L-arabinose transferase-like glycosyltransferase
MKNLKKVFGTDIFWLLLILSIGVFVRFWRINLWQYFTYDQARDYLIVKRIIVDHKLTLVGPTVLAPGVYLPPFYYYSLIFPLLLFKFHLFGPDLYTALLGSLSIIVFFYLAKDFFGRFSAILASFIFALNPYLIQASRHAWNPNTISLFTLLFAFSFTKFTEQSKGKYLILAAFSLSWALNLHYTVVVFLPLLAYLFYKEFSQRKFSRYFLLAILVFVLFVSPLGFFELRHNFPNLKGISHFLESGSALKVGPKIVAVVTNAVKMPTTLIMGLNQEHNLTINPSHILLFDQINPFLGGTLTKFKIVIGFLLTLSGLFILLRSKTVPARVARMVGLFFSFGLLIRLIFPPGSFYFYHFTFLFPFVLLLPAVIFLSLSFSKPGRIAAIFLAVLISFLAFGSSSLKNEVKTESYFLSAAKVIAKDNLSTDKIAVAANLADPFRWDHNALEYRYFLETVYKIPSQNWESKDYKSANVLYLIDERGLKEPLKLGGMEVEAFAPRRIEKMWTTSNGQKIYKMKR